MLCVSACRFRNGIKDLEVMMQNLIVTAFETVTTVEQGVEVLDIFMHLSSREVTDPMTHITRSDSTHWQWRFSVGTRWGAQAPQILPRPP